MSVIYTLLYNLIRNKRNKKGGIIILGLISENMFIFSMVILIFSYLLLTLATYTFKFRAFTNKKAWGGKTKPLLVSGAILFLIGIVMTYLFYPFN